MTHHLHGIAFDLDGTLVDSAPDVAHALNTALATVSLPAFDLVTVRGWIGDGPDATIARALQASRARSAASADALARQLRASFDSATLCAPLDHGRVYDGIATLLHGLAGRWPLAVVTNKPTTLARAVLAAAGLSQHFAVVYGADAPEQRKPSPWLLQRAAKALDIQLASLLMVGDGMPDLQAARNAGCPSAWVRWGYGSPSPHKEDVPLPLWQLRVPGDLLRYLEGPGDSP